MSLFDDRNPIDNKSLFTADGIERDTTGSFLQRSLLDVRKYLDYEI